MKVSQFDPYIQKEEIASVTEVLKKNWITEGEKKKLLEEKIKKFTGVKYVHLVPNGTLALFVGLKILDIGPGDEVIVPDFTFIASATSVVLCGAKPVFADINKDDFNINVSKLEQVISKKTKAIMPVHIYGQSAQMDKIKRIAKKYNLKIIEDAAQGIGVTFKNKHTGTIGNVGCISFFADKTITMGEGGAVLTNSRTLADKCLYFKNQGRKNRGSFIHKHIGYNFRITDMQAALGVIQMGRLNWIIKRKNYIENLYKKYLKEVEQIQFPLNNKLGTRVPFRINLLVEEVENLIKYLTKKEIGVRRFFYPLHLQPCFNKTNSVKRSKIVNSIEVFKKGISLPSGVNLKNIQIKYVCDSIKEFYAKNK